MKLNDIKDGKDKIRIERNIIEQNKDMIISHTACRWTVFTWPASLYFTRTISSMEGWIYVLIFGLFGKAVNTL